MPDQPSADGLQAAKLSLPLEYQQDLLQELRSEDELVILARGLGLLHLVTNLLHLYDAAGGNLVLVVGADESESRWIGDALIEQKIISNAAKARSLTTLTDSVLPQDRQDMYSRGGIFSVTNRILIVDILTNILNTEMVTGVIVLHADKVTETSTQAFILRKYREANKTGFLKAFSDTPEPFLRGFNPLAKMMRNLFLRKASLWPRFHVTVAKSLEGQKKAEVIELEIPMTEAMTDIQNAVLECIEASVGELKRSNVGLELEDWSVDNALSENFDIAIRSQLEPMWHRISWRLKQIVRDLTTLREVLLCLLTYDAVSFNDHLEDMLRENAERQQSAGSKDQESHPWLLLDAANVLFETARRRVYRQPAGTTSVIRAPADLPGSLPPVLEEQPKWAVLAQVLEEIERDMYFNPAVRDDSSGVILIMCTGLPGDWFQYRQIKEYLQTMHIRVSDADTAKSPSEDTEHQPSASYMMQKKFRQYISKVQSQKTMRASINAEKQKSLEVSGDTRRGPEPYRGRGPPNKRRRIRGGGADPGPTRNANGNLTPTADRDSRVDIFVADDQLINAGEESNRGNEADSLDDTEDYYELLDMQDLVVVHPYSGDMDDHLLEELKPRYVIMYEPDAAFIRRVEVYRSSHSDRNVRVYFTYYGHSVEEQRYLSSVRREKDAFTKLIREKRNMTVTLETRPGGGPGDDPQDAFLRTINTRIAGGGRLTTATASRPLVVVDIREFRSSLVSLLDANGLKIEPVQLTVGDYILSPDMCVERKSISDLIGSFKSGRLHTQAETMCQYYKWPVLLIEFARGEAFTLEAFADTGGKGKMAARGGGGAAGSSSTAFGASGDDDTKDLHSKIVLLTIHFPRLKIVWSSDPYQTATIFAELKKNQDEPNPNSAVGIGLVPGSGGGAQAAAGGAGIFAQVPGDMLRCLPGVTEVVAQRLMLEAGSLLELSRWSESDIAAVVGREVGRQVWGFLNRKLMGG